MRAKAGPGHLLAYRFLRRLAARQLRALPKTKRSRGYHSPSPSSAPSLHCRHRDDERDGHDSRVAKFTRLNSVGFWPADVEIAPNILTDASTSIAFFALGLEGALRCQARTTIMGHCASRKMSFRVNARGASHFPLQARTMRSAACFLAKRTISAAGFPWARTIRTCK